MLQDILQIQSLPLTNLKNTHFVGLMTFTRDQFAAFFTTENAAPAKLAAQLLSYNQKYNALDEAYRVNDYSLDTPELKKADTDCDHTVMGIKKMAAAQQAFDFNPAVKSAADRFMQAFDKFEIDPSEDYLGENNKLQQFCQEISSSEQLTADAETLGLTAAMAQLAEKVAMVRDLLTQRGMAQAPKGAMKAARIAIETEYRWLLTLTNATALLDENEHRYDPLIQALNQNIEYLRIHALSSGTANANVNPNDNSDDNGNDDNGGGDNPSPNPNPNPNPNTGGDDNGSDED